MSTPAGLVEDHLFVYGTLRAGAGADPSMHRLLQRHTAFVGKGRFHGTLYDLGAYPGLVPGPNAGAGVVGEVYRLTHATRTEVLSRLDRYEGYDPASPGTSLYLRARHPVRLDRGGHVTAWVYVYNRSLDGRRRISSGDWLAR